MSDLLKEFEKQKEQLNYSVKLFSNLGYGDHKKICLQKSNTTINLNQQDREVLFGKKKRDEIPEEVLIVRLNGGILLIPEVKK